MVENGNINVTNTNNSERDALTGVKNKLSYVKYEKELDELIKEGVSGPFTIMIFDINDMKHENDVKGMEAGDEYIKEGCRIICDIFDHSPVFRLGGDEFAAILRGSDYDNRMTLAAKYGARQYENKIKGLVNMAFGMADFNPKKDIRVQDVYIRADRLMNENKKNCRNCRSARAFFDEKEFEPSVRFYVLYEQLVSAMMDFGKIEVPKIEQILIDICNIFRLSKAVTRVFKNPQEEKSGQGEILCCFDTGREGEVISTIRYVTSVQSGAVMNVYMSPDEKPLTDEEKWKVELVMRTTLSFVARNRLNTMVDQLTYFDEDGYPNLRTLNRDMMKMVMENRINGMVAFHYNLRNFAIVNKEYGRDTGDIIMKLHFDTVQNAMGPDGVLARMGGDNFVGICPGDTFKNVLSILTHTMVHVNNGNGVSIQTKAGVFCISEKFPVHNPSDVWPKIISAFNVAKGGEHEHIVFYDDAFIAKKEKSMRIQQLLPDALKDEEFKPFYQPKVNLKTGELSGAEALCRWFHDGKIIPPNDFIPVFEETSDICRLDLYMLEHVCRDIRRWLDSGKDPVRVSVNFSRKHMMNIGLTDIIAEIVDRYDVPHKYVEIELTETTTDVEFADLKRVVANLHELGFYTSIDDFGMGFSSLNLIRDIPWDVVKIDRSFLPAEGEDENSPNYIMYKHVVAMARELGREVLTEGTESEFHVKVLKENNCEFAQGYYFDKPLMVDEFEKRLVIRQYI